MASGSEVAVGAPADHNSGAQRTTASEKCGSDPATEDSSESDGDAEPAKAFHRRISTSKAIKNGNRYAVACRDPGGVTALEVDAADACSAAGRFSGFTVHGSFASQEFGRRDDSDTRVRS
ncbi:hypothetical protein HPB47_026318 [Ixodes persulcatus]|uniref:Uncharacterized protein n=1 Tax=Ixodes persulcatus TaxID=34615 RepID=A0AC60Q124_IXOPE|nr:hypothetical protein HPB47_026318 [Ixodes persulcatus]